MCDYVASKNFPELRKIDIKFIWAQKIIETFLKENNHSSLMNLFDDLRDENNCWDIMSKSIDFNNRLSKMMSYKLLKFPEDFLNKYNKSKFNIPDRIV